MPKRYDSISIERLPSGAYRYRTRDKDAGKYENKTWRRTDEDKDRDTPGTAAGDRWAEAQLARYRLGLATAEPADLATVVAAYVKQLGSDRPRNRPLNPVHVRDVQRTLDNLVAFRSGIDLNKTMAARGAIREWLKQLQAIEKNKHGKVLRVNRTLSAATKTRYLIHVKAMIKWALGEGMIGRDPIANVRTPAPDRNIPPVFTLAQVRNLLGKKRTDEPAWLWISIMILAGLRRGEALALTWSDLLWKQSLVKVAKGKGSAARLVPMQADLRTLLSPLGGPDAKHLRMGRIITGSDFTGANRKHEWTVFRRVLKAVKIEPDLGLDQITQRKASLHPHSCRHTFGGMMLASGYDGMLLRHAMGHRQADTTGDYSKSAQMFRKEITAEGWEPGELQLLRRKSRASDRRERKG